MSVCPNATIFAPDLLTKKLNKMKKFLFASVLALVSFGAFAQDEKPLTFSIGVDGAVPVGNWFTSGTGKFSDYYSFGIGGSAQANYNLDETLALTLNAGYISYMPKTVSGVKMPSFSVVPVLAGIEYNFTPQVFASAQLGYSFYGGDAVKGATTSGFSYAPGIGFRFAEKFSALLKYQGTSAKMKASGASASGNFSHIGIRLAYSF